MSIGIYAFGHGGGVPGPIPNTPVGSAGNTNFAIVPNVNSFPPGRPGDDYLRNGFQVYGDRTVAWLGNRPYWLIDCGPETMLSICGVMSKWTRPVAETLKGIFLTHCHDDHTGGLKSLGYRAKFIEKTKPYLYYPIALAKLLDSQLAEMAFMNPTSTEHGPSAFYTMWPLNRGKIDDWGDFEITHFPVYHNCFDGAGNPFPAFGYKITTKEGKIVTFSGDTAFPIEAKHFEESDLVIHDVQFYSDGSKNDHVHCPYHMLRDAVRPELRHKVLLTHTSHDLPPEAIADGFKLLRGGDVIVLP